MCIRDRFDVDSYESFCRIEIDTALRDIAAHYSYDHAVEGELTLRGHAEEVAELLGERLNARLDVGGMMAVSYTHLDVYKRQVYIIKACIFCNFGICKNALCQCISNNNFVTNCCKWCEFQTFFDAIN